MARACFSQSTIRRYQYGRMALLHDWPVMAGVVTMADDARCLYLPIPCSYLANLQSGSHRPRWYDLLDRRSRTHDVAQHAGAPWIWRSSHLLRYGDTLCGGHEERVSPCLTSCSSICSLDAETRSERGVSTPMRRWPPGGDASSDLIARSVSLRLASGCTGQSVAQNAVVRLKPIFGSRFRARRL